MMTYIVIGICLALLAIVVIIAAKPIGMGIEARRNNSHSKNEKEDVHSSVNSEYNDFENENLHDQILKLKQLKDDGILTEEEFKKAKKKLFD